MRRERLVTIQSDDPDNRDKGKTFKLREMPAAQAERWAVRAGLALANAGARLPDGALNHGLKGFTSIIGRSFIEGLRSLAGLHYPDVEGLMREMMACVVYVPGGQLAEQEIRDDSTSQIEEVSTRFKLRAELADLHLGFSLADAIRTMGTEPQPTQSAATS